VAPQKESDFRLHLIAQDDVERAQQKRSWVRLIPAVSPGKVLVVKPEDEKGFIAIFEIVLNHLSATRNVLLSSDDFRVLAILEVLAIAIGDWSVKSVESYLSATFSTLIRWSGAACRI
jgi:hypothetical protein